MLAGAVLAGSASAQTLTYYAGEEALSPSQTYTFTNVTTRDMGVMKQIIIDPDLKIKCSDAGTIEVVASADQTIQMCAGGDCVSNKYIEKTGINVEADEMLPLQLEYIDQVLPGETFTPSVATVLLTAKYTGKFNTIRKITIVMDNKEGDSSVTILENDDTFYVENGVIVYNLDKATKVNLYDMDGKCALSTTLAGSGNYSLEGLNSGIYVYTLDGTSKTGKVFVK